MICQVKVLPVFKNNGKIANIPKNTLLNYVKNDLNLQQATVIASHIRDSLVEKAEKADKSEKKNQKASAKEPQNGGNDISVKFYIENHDSLTEPSKIDGVQCFVMLELGSTHSHPNSSTSDLKHVSAILGGKDSIFHVEPSESCTDASWVFVRKNAYKNYDSHPEMPYLNLLRELMGYHMRDPSKFRPNRTDISTVSTFGRMIRLDISDNKIPLLTTKRVPFRHVLEELLWFCRGDTDATILSNKGVHIWDGNSSREFLDRQGLNDYEVGDIGPGYGFQWRHSGGVYSGPKTKVVYENIGVDQLSYVETLLKNDPMSRRILLSAWSPKDLKATALPPCHVMAQWYVEEENDKKRLSCMLTMRSCDTFLGLPWNIVSYSTLTHILAVRAGMEAKELVVSMGDCHLYGNCIEQTIEQLTRECMPMPKLSINPSVEYKSWDQIDNDDFCLMGYYPHASIKAAMAI